MNKFLLLVLVALFAISLAQNFAPKNSGINVLPLSVDVDADVTLTVNHVFSHDENTLTEDSGIETLDDQHNLVLEEEITQAKPQAAPVSKEVVTEEILDDAEALSLLNAKTEANQDSATLSEESLVQEAETSAAKIEQLPNKATCLEFCKKTGSDDAFCQKHCEK